MSKRAGLAIALGVTTIVVAVAAFTARRAAPPTQSTPSEIAASSQDPLIAERTRGDTAATLTFYEIADFQCPACRFFFTDVLPDLEREYIATGKLKLVFVNFPIPQLHANAAAAHELAMCAAEQNRFWPIHDLLYRTQPEWSDLEQPRDYFLSLADSAGLDRPRLETCVDSGTMRAVIEADARGAWEAGIRQTPSLVVGGNLISGAAPLEALRPLLDSLVAAGAR